MRSAMDIPLLAAVQLVRLKCGLEHLLGQLHMSTY